MDYPSQVTSHRSFLFIKNILLSEIVGYNGTPGVPQWHKLGKRANKRPHSFHICAAIVTNRHTSTQTWHSVSITSQLNCKTWTRNWWAWKSNVLDQCKHTTYQLLTAQSRYHTATGTYKERNFGHLSTNEFYVGIHFIAKCLYPFDVLNFFSKCYNIHCSTPHVDQPEHWTLISVSVRTVARIIALKKQPTSTISGPLSMKLHSL